MAQSWKKANDKKRKSNTVKSFADRLKEKNKYSTSYSKPSYNYSQSIIYENSSSEEDEQLKIMKAEAVKQRRNNISDEEKAKK